MQLLWRIRNRQQNTLQLFITIAFVCATGFLTLKIFLFSNQSQNSVSLKANLDQIIGKSLEVSELSNSLQNSVDLKRTVQISERFVHFDLKGAPPRVSYFHQLFPFLRQLGSTGILLEWEDMFPFSGPKLEKLRNGYAYTEEDVETIIRNAEKNKLEVIPLIQTFGHLEMLLKHEEFIALREEPKYPQVICPSHPQIYEILFQMIDQVIEKHPKSKAIHIGSDEAYYVGRCPKCRKLLESKFGNSTEKLMLEHVTKIAKYIRKKHKITVLMWNDMFAEAEPSLMNSYKFGKLVQPVIWGYATDVEAENYFPPGMFQRFSEVFPTVWIASSFKGANGPAQTFIDVKLYLQNHFSWISLIEHEKSKFPKLAGIILTGWQRFDHFAVLCEIFPVGIPSLAVDLIAIQSNDFDYEKIRLKARNLLKCAKISNKESKGVDDSLKFRLDEINTMNVKIGKNLKESLPFERRVELYKSPWSECEFPGSRIFALVEKLHGLREIIEDMFAYSEFKGWLQLYNLNHKYSKTFFAQKYLSRTNKLINSLNMVGKQLRIELREIFFDETVNEFLFENVQIFLNRLKPLVESLENLANAKSFQNRPLAFDKLEF